VLDVADTFARRGLTQRERDCLRLIGTGHASAAGAAELGIARSTFEKHLASARRKLGVRTTAQAVLLHAEERRRVRPGGGFLSVCRQPSSLSEIDFADRLRDTDGLDDCLAVLHKSVTGLGITTINFGVVADPAGVVTYDTGHMISSLSPELLRLYHAMGGFTLDPTPRWAAKASGPFAHTISQSVPSVFGRDLPPGLAALVEGFFDNDLDCMICVPSRDPATNATLILNFMFSGIRPPEFVRFAASHIGALDRIGEIFFDHVMMRRLLRRVPDLTRREEETLRLVACGFRLAEVGDRMNVSPRAAEKHLSGARRKLKARTNAEAVYRGTVYRVFG
jgi:DNA-binding CsgD family transcriptional regulator